MSVKTSFYQGRIRPPLQNNIFLAKIIGGLLGLSLLIIIVAWIIAPPPPPEPVENFSEDSGFVGFAEEEVAAPRELTPEEKLFLPTVIPEGTTLFNKTMTVFEDNWRLVYADDFENGLTRWRSVRVRDALNLTNTTVRSGNSSLVLDQSNINAVFNIGYPLRSGVFVCHFYDALTPYEEHMCAVSLQSLPSEKDGIYAGIEVANNVDYYSLFFPNENNTWTTTDIARHEGWHKVLFFNDQGNNLVYLDDQLVLNTTEPLYWQYAHLLIHDKVVLPSPGIFDDVLVAQVLPK